VGHDHFIRIAEGSDEFIRYRFPAFDKLVGFRTFKFKGGFVFMINNELIIMQFLNMRIGFPYLGEAEGVKER
jgi:hypothetical protein